MGSFHKVNSQRAKHWPHSMLTTSTHDTKRGEDTRARLAVLSEMPQEWATQVSTWSRIIKARRGDIEGTLPPDRNEEYMFYQLLVGSWPAELTGTGDLNTAALQCYLKRLKGAMLKSLREAKVHTTWGCQNRPYEEATLSFIDTALDPSSAFLSSFLPFQERVARLGVQNSLVQTTLKVTSPGVPDFYQGAELWDLSLVDPDNRRPVDFERRRLMLDEVITRPIEELLNHWHDGAIKLWLTSKLLDLRASYTNLFENGRYEPLIGEGLKADLLCAFERFEGDHSAMVVAARFPHRREMDPGWSDTAIPVPPNLQGKRLRDVITGAEVHQNNQRVDAAEVFGPLPIAILMHVIYASATG
jgi:(1->4)-alpha-D-glucan 1-alpha-D-glucosylmutase